jgi:hypothetical protein
LSSSLRDSLQIKPRIEAEALCHACGTRLQPQGLLWQGIHVCAEYRCTQCAAAFHEDLPVGHATLGQFRVDAAHNLSGGEPEGVSWFGEPLRRSLEQPDASPVPFEVRVARPCTRAVILNCLDFLYGHSLLKLLNATRHLAQPDWGLVVIVPRFLAWMVPDGVAETWTVDLPPGRAQRYFPDLHRRIGAELERFAEVRLSKAWSHPDRWDPTKYSRVARHDFAAKDYRVTFVWRGDRLWHGDWGLSAYVANASFTRGALRALQRRKVLRLLERVRSELPEAKPTVAGVGREGGFPDWVDDRRIDIAGKGAGDGAVDADVERALCQTYAESRVVIGVHGSNMLLASGHAGMSLDLMPESRWPNIAQDVLYAEGGAADADLRMGAYRHRYLPILTPPALVAEIAGGMVRRHDRAQRRFVEERA